ncbi:hypothetical protein ELE36_15415 [Pseudolysobacter antarcticus]|uniref:SH3b domain-containing protein n=1 Tax=Pseudolysobacter antarcticus TaxID=2511995 RepID=A0A411HMG6_9GAMM|nr:SH3 domain-containing protein [Pseudolysobacter antarcticus]QBB71634.1 hypothetical protein ELE36_15415 [Pseudolysobacter antarcticus]
MKYLVAIAASFLLFSAVTQVFAADGYVLGDVNLRAGPDSSYPSVTMLSAGTPVAIQGCVDGWSWCDVAAGNDRGWVAGNFLQEDYQGQRVLVPDYGVRIGIPIVGFVFGTYWENNYRNRPWYGGREHWSQVRPQYRPIALHADPRGHPHDDSNRNRPEDLRSAHPPEHTGNVQPRQAAVVAAAPSNPRPLPGATVPQHPLAAPPHPRKPEDHRPAEPVAGMAKAAPVQRAAPPPKAIVEGKPAPASLPKKEPPAKSEPEHEDGKDKKQH